MLLAPALPVARRSLLVLPRPWPALTSCAALHCVPSRACTVCPPTPCTVPSPLAGDLHDKEWRQAITAAGSGCQAALAAERYLSAKGLAVEFAQEAAAEEVRCACAS